ncbi:MAG TPA: ImmA/IrrE family metallo-endopeptidase [Pirellulales bacterium]|jgi:hypothetical protein|nr:ImmA/IrrE family metallo-endopeptidase [Pirellulales bacterium]
MFSEIPQSQFIAALEETIRELLLAGKIAGPPIDAFRVAAANGVVVALDEGQSGRARYVRLACRPGEPRSGRSVCPSILIRPDPRPERQQWAVAHELGEHTAQAVFARLAIDPADAPVAARESVANYLASRLLLPSTWFAATGQACDWDLQVLKQVFRTASHELIARRMLDFEPPVCISIFDHGRLHFRATNAIGRPPPPTAIEADCRRAAHDTGKTATQIGGAFRVRAWPIHEPGWKREVVRLEPAAGTEWLE